MGAKNKLALFFCFFLLFFFAFSKSFSVRALLRNVQSIRGATRYVPNGKIKFCKIKVISLFIGSRLTKPLEIGRCKSKKGALYLYFTF